ncbi:hypothetical protein [Nodosilinea sp. FACHB-13]|nr:hypothetical protein [Nodosilinea sp. FACHB-13]MBD2108230.1 hypothetical protein [Nodosilinea sp. FACHB-13]
MNDSRLLQDPQRSHNDARNLLFVTLPSLLGLVGLLGLTLFQAASL